MKLPVFAALLLASPAAAVGQDQPAGSAAPAPGGGLGALGGLLGGAIPSVASAGVGNTAGLLGYCIKNRLVSGANASSVLGALASRAGVPGSTDFTAGQAGTLRSGRSQLSLDNLRGQMKTKLCDLVLTRARSFM